jgi:hypothetical protein
LGRSAKYVNVPLQGDLTLRRSRELEVEGKLLREIINAASIDLKVMLWARATIHR